MLSPTLRILAFVIAFGSFALVLADWQSFRITWGHPNNNTKAFAKMPETEKEARTMGFFKLPGKCSAGRFLGRRYMKGLDPSVVLMFDVNGYIAGIQNGFPKKYLDNVNTTFSFEKSPAYQVGKVFGEDVYFITAYFVDPKIICEGGRTKEQYLKQKAGTGLYFQNGTDPILDSDEVPFVEAYMAGSGWKKGQYFKTMGVHYWYETEDPLICANFFPIAPIYNEGAIATFSFVTFGDYNFSKRFEHPLYNELPLFWNPVPNCLYDEYKSSGGLSCLHVFFSTDPWNC